MAMSRADRAGRAGGGRGWDGDDGGGDDGSDGVSGGRRRSGFDSPIRTGGRGGIRSRVIRRRGLLGGRIGVVIRVIMETNRRMHRGMCRGIRLSS